MIRPRPGRPAPILSAFSFASLCALGACTPQSGIEEEPDIRAPLAVATGEPLSCLPSGPTPRQIVHDDYTIDFVVGSRRYRNTLQDRCPQLGFERAITYETSGGRLCTPQIIYVLQSFGGGLQRGPACALGEFVPIELVDEESGNTAGG